MEDRSKRRARLILIVGLLLALVAGAGAFLVASSGQSQVAAPIPTTQVLVAARELPSRTAIAATDLKVIAINTDAVPPSAIKAEEQKDVIGKVNTVPIAIGEVLLSGKFAASVGATFTVFPPNTPTGAAGAIPAGTPSYRAMSISVPDQFAVGGAVQVGDIVDILYTLNFDPAKYFLPQQGIVAGSPNDRRTTDFSAKIAIENVPVIARALTVYTIRTDAVTAERLAYLQAAGATMQMLLRAPLDQRAAGTQGATFEPVFRAFSFPVPQKIPAP